jgi:hypothetical protein
MMSNPGARSRSVHDWGPRGDSTTEIPPKTRFARERTGPRKASLLFFFYFPFYYFLLFFYPFSDLILLQQNLFTSRW